MILTHPTYTYPATVISIHDGDTCHMNVDLEQSIRLVDRDFGFHVYVEGGRLRLHETFRFFGINAPELATQAGKDSLAYLLTLIQVGTNLTAAINKSPSQEKYGRWLCTLVLDDGRNVNDLMVSSGHAVPYLV